ncbi:Arc family DNA-binding protein [Rhizobium beringeri]|nr:Arc family DNA-binding protein [Rhizobium beringeri]
MGRSPKTPNDELDKFLLRMPDGLRDRIKAVADENNRSMNAEIVATLETIYPPKSMDVKLLAEFLDSLVGFSDDEGYAAYIATVNDAFAKTKHHWTVDPAWDGVVKFYPYATKEKSDKKD